MRIDSFTIAALADELRLAVMGGRVQQIWQLTPLSFELEIYAQRRRRYLHLSADPQAPCAYLQSTKPRRGAGKPTPLTQLFRKYLRGSLLLTVEQPPFERLLMFHFSGRAGESTTVLEMLGSRSNLLFLDAAGRILALARPGGPKTGPRRALLPNHPYRLPRPQQKLTPADLTPAALQTALSRLPPETPLGKALAGLLAGLSPFIGQEIAFRACGSATAAAGDVADVQLLLESIRPLYARITGHAWAPHVTRAKDGRVDRFAPVALTHLPHAEPVAGMSAALEAHFAPAQTAPSDGYAAARLPVQQAIERARARLERRLQKLAQDAAALRDPDHFKQSGDAILTYSSRIKPGQAELTADWTGDIPLTIALDPALSPAENAQRYFARYRKAQRAAAIIPQQRQTVLLQLEYLSQLSLDLELAESRPEIDAVSEALRQAGFGKARGAKQSPPAPPPESRPRRFTAPGGFTVWVGRNARQNHRLTFGRAAPDDVWLHARGVPGSHVVVSAAQGNPPQFTILWAAGLAAYFSKARGKNRAEVSYTRKKHVRPIKGAPPGLVTIRNEKTVTVSPRKPSADEPAA